MARVAWTPVSETTNLRVSGAKSGSGQSILNLRLKEYVMNEKSQAELELQIVELGDAKELTMGIPAQEHSEDNPALARKLQP